MTRAKFAIGQLSDPDLLTPPAASTQQWLFVTAALVAPALLAPTAIDSLFRTWGRGLFPIGTIIPPAAMILISFLFWQRVAPLPRSTEHMPSVGIALGFVFGAFAAGANLLLVDSASIAQTRAGWFELETFVVALQLLLVVPLAEEAAFRGIFYRRLRERCNPLAATLISSALFAAFHGGGTATIYAFILAITLALTYELTGSLVAPFIIHSMYNAVPFWAYYSSAQTPTTPGPIWLALALLSLAFSLVCRQAATIVEDPTLQPSSEH